MQKNLPFIKGLELNKGFFSDVVEPLLGKKYPVLQYSAALLGYGSDVMGYDNETSMDHNWGPRLQLFVDEAKLIPEIDDYLKHELPFCYKGFPVNFSEPAYDLVQSMEFTDKKPIRHLIEINTPLHYFGSRYSLNKLGHFSNEDWLAFNDQALLEITSGLVFHDGLGKINPLREELKFFPPDIYKLKLAALWKNIWDNEAFIGRCIEIDDYIGLKINASRIAGFLMKILFYLEGKYIPYDKWFGTAFNELAIYKGIEKIILDILNENVPKKIEENLCVLYERVVDESNKNPELPYIKNKVRDFFERPYKVIFAENIVDDLINSIQDVGIRIKI